MTVSTISTPAQDAILVDARLLLDYEKLSRSVYRSVGVDPKSVEQRPYYAWLGQSLKMDVIQATQLQVAYEARLAEKLFLPNQGIKELGTLDLVHLFVEAKSTVYVYGHETPDALQAVIARVGLPNSVIPLALLEPNRLHHAVSSILNSEIAPSWLLTYCSGLTSRDERRIVNILGNRGVLVNAKPTQTSRSDDKLLDLVNERWSYL